MHPSHVCLPPNFHNRSSPTLLRPVPHPSLHSRSPEEGPRLVVIPLTGLEHPQVVIRLGMGGAHGDGDLEALVREGRVTDTNGHLADVVPDITWWWWWQ